MVSQKDIVLIPFPFSDLTTAKFRPALVMSNDYYNKRSKDFVAIPLTSSPKVREYSLKITNEDLSSGSLPLPSRERVDKIISLEQALVKRTFGQVRQDIFDNIVRELLKLLD